MLVKFGLIFLTYDCIVYFFAGCRLYFERKTDCLVADSPAFTHFVNTKNRIVIYVNRPPSTKYEICLTTDSRWTIEKLREVISSNLELPSEDLRMFKGILGRCM